MQLIFRSLLVFVLLIVLYSVFVKVWSIGKIEPINQRQGNTISVQEFVFEKSQTADNLIVGSSLAYRMKNNILPSNYWNLAQGGGSIFKGLNLIQQTNSIPEIILIETNILDRNKGTFEEAVHPIDRYVKTWLPITQEKYRPVTYGINMLYKALGKKGGDKIATAPSAKAKEVMDKMQKENYSKDITKDSTTLQNLRLLKTMVDELKAKGSCVVFFEMPISCGLDQLPKAITMRNKVKEYFPDNSYHYLPKYDCKEFQTTDGIHLDAPSAEKILGMIVEDIEKIDCK